MRWRIPLVVVLALFVAASCQDKPVEPTEYPDLTVPTFNFVNSQSVTGHADASYPEFGDYYEKNSFSAVRHADGSISGQWQLWGVWDGEHFTVHGTVTCLTIAPDGKTAWLGGTVERAPWGDPADFEANWTVVDNGEPGAGNDLTNGITFDTFIDAAYHCATGDGFMYSELRPIDRGNIQVKP